MADPPRPPGFPPHQMWQQYGRPPNLTGALWPQAPPPPRVVVRHQPLGQPRPSGDPQRAALEAGAGFPPTAAAFAASAAPPVYSVGHGRGGLWSGSEEALLNQLVGELERNAWATVAERLGTHRTARAVEQRWRDAHPSAPRWTADEEARLRTVVTQLRTQGRAAVDQGWPAVARALGTHRSPVAVETHWQTMGTHGSLPPAPRVVLRLAPAGSHGVPPPRVVVRATPVSRPPASSGRTERVWSSDEETQMKHLVGELGLGSWGLIALRLGTNRPANQVEQRWRSSFSTKATGQQAGASGSRGVRHPPAAAPRPAPPVYRPPGVDAVLQAGLDVASGAFDVSKPTRATDADANELATVLIRLDGALNDLAKDGRALIQRREEAVRQLKRAQDACDGAHQCQKAELILAQTRVDLPGGKEVLDAVDSHWARVYRSHARRVATARDDLDRLEAALVDCLGKLEGGGKVGSRATVLLPKPAPAPRGRPRSPRVQPNQYTSPAALPPPHAGERPVLLGARPAAANGSAGLRPPTARMTGLRLTQAQRAPPAPSAAAPAAKRARVGAPPGASTNAIPALNGAGAAGGVERKCCEHSKRVTLEVPGQHLLDLDVVDEAHAGGQVDARRGQVRGYQ